MAIAGVPITVVLSVQLHDSKPNKFSSEALVTVAVTVVLPFLTGEMRHSEAKEWSGARSVSALACPAGSLLWFRFLVWYSRPRLWVFPGFCFG